MAVNEAPRLTTARVVAVMVLVFFCCLFADQFQCTKNGRQNFCSGARPYYCGDGWCREQVRLFSQASTYHSCSFEGTHEVLFELVEVGPSLVSDAGSRVSAYMAEELRSRIDAGLFTRKPSSENSRRSWWIIEVEVFNEYDKLSTTQTTLKEHPRNVTQYSVSSDVFTLPSYRPGMSFPYRHWDEAIESLLPTSKLDNATQLKAYFPNLHRSLEAAVERRKARTAAESVKCDAITLIVYIAVSPLAAVRSVWDTPENSKAQLSLANQLVSGAVTRYITTNARLLKYLNDVRYVYLYIPVPSRQFKSQKSYSQERGSSGYGSYAVAAETTNLPTSPAFCNASRNVSHTAQCLRGCEGYQAFNQRAVIVGGQLKSGSYQRVFNTVYATSSAYYDCYFRVLKDNSKPWWGLDFSVDAEAHVFDDCLHLSPAGGKAFASCLLETKGYVERYYYPFYGTRRPY